MAKRPQTKTGIQTTLGAIAAAGAALHRFSELRLSTRAAYQIHKLAALVDAEAKIYDERRRVLLKEFGTARAAKTSEEKAKYGDSLVDISADNSVAFFAELKKLEDFPVTIAWTPLAFEDLAGSQVSAAEITALGALLAEPVTP